MSEVPIQIRNPEVVRAIRRLAARTGRPITEVVAEAVNAQLRRLGNVDTAEAERRIRLANEIVDRFNALPRVGPWLTDEDLYDEDGLPK